MTNTQVWHKKHTIRNSPNIYINTYKHICQKVHHHTENTEFFLEIKNHGTKRKSDTKTVSFSRLSDIETMTREEREKKS